MKRYKSKLAIGILSMMLAIGQAYGQASDSLKHYLEVAAHNNPGINADFLAYKASLQKIPQAGAYKDPELEMGFYLEPMDIIGGRQVAQFKVMQMFPWFGTKKAAQTEATHMAKMSYEKFKESRDNLYLNVYTQWFALCKLQQQLINNRKNRELLTQLEQLAVRKFASPMSSTSSGYSLPNQTSSKQGNAAPSSASGGMSGMGSMGGGTAASSSGSSSGGMSSMGGSDSGMGSTSPGMSTVLRIQLEITGIDNSIENLLSEIEAEKAKFNALLNRPALTEVAIPDNFEQIPFILDEASAIQIIKNQNPMLNMITEESLAYKAKGEMDKKMGYPMFGIGVEYMLNKKTDDAMFGMGSMNGKDMIMPMLSVSIPIYRNKYKAQQRESKFWWQSNQEKYTNTLNTLESELYKTKHQLGNAKRQIDLYKKQEELANIAYSLIIQEFTTGKSDLSNVIQVQRQLLDFQLKKAEAIADYNTMVASIQKLLSFKDSEQ